MNHEELQEMANNAPITKERKEKMLIANQRGISNPVAVPSSLNTLIYLATGVNLL